MNSSISKFILVKVILCGCIFYSGLALIFHVRWLIPFMQGGIAHGVPFGQIPTIWYLVQISTNIVLLISSYLLLLLFKSYTTIGFFNKNSSKIFNGLITCCILLALIAAIQIVSSNYSELHMEEWRSFESIANLILRSFTILLVLREPQTMYILLALTFWVVKQFVTRALIVKTENESFI